MNENTLGKVLRFLDLNDFVMEIYFTKHYSKVL